MIYYFRLLKIQGDNMDVHVEPSEGVDAEARNLGDGLYDLPGGDCIWHGYVEADDASTARQRVEQAY